VSSRGELLHGAGQRLLDLPPSRPTPGPAAPEAPHRRSAGCSAPRDRPRPRVSTTRRTATAAARPCPKRPEQAPPHDQTVRSSLHDLTSPGTRRGTTARGPVTGRGRTTHWLRAERGQRYESHRREPGRYPPCRVSPPPRAAHRSTSTRRRRCWGFLTFPWHAGYGGTARPPRRRAAPRRQQPLATAAASPAVRPVPTATSTCCWTWRTGRDCSHSALDGDLKRILHATLTSHPRKPQPACGPRRRARHVPLSGSRAPG